MNIVDIKACVELARKKIFWLPSTILLRLRICKIHLDLGADIVMHSVTKYLSGHSDVIMGALVVNDEKLYQELHFIMNSCGAVPGPQDSFLVLRGIKTLHLRMERHCFNGRKIAEYLKSHSKIGKVYWPGFADHPNHAIAKAQMKDFGGMLSFTLKDDSLRKSHNVNGKCRTLFAC